MQRDLLACTIRGSAHRLLSPGPHREYGPHRCRRFEERWRSRQTCFDRAEVSSKRNWLLDLILEIGGGICESLPDVFLLQVRICPFELLTVSVGGKCEQHTLHGDSHSANAR